MSRGSHDFHIEKEDKLRLYVTEHTPPLMGHYMRFTAGSNTLILYVPTSQAHELAVLLNRAAVYFGGISLGCPACTCEPGSPDDACREHGFKRWQEEQARDAARSDRDG